MNWISPDPYAFLFALFLEILDRPIWWRGHLITPLIHPVIHPVSLVYKLGAMVAKPGGIARGLMILTLVTAPMVTAAVCFRSVRGDGILWSLAEGYLLKLSFSITHITHGCRVGYASGRSWEYVREFVRRSLRRGERWLINSACIETAAESLVDSYISPLMWYVLLGLPGAWLQRAVNTADGLIGFREYGRAGAPAAVLDTALNFIPARASLLFLIFGIRCAEALTQRRRLESINARWPISTMAAALGVTLEKRGSYAVGCGGYPAEIEVAQALWLIHATAALVGVMFTLAIWLGPQH